MRFLMEYALVALLSVAPSMDYSRAYDIAEGIADAVDSSSIPRNWTDEDTVLTLVALGWAESRFAQRIQDCQCLAKECDNGRSVGMWQIMRGNRAMCGDVEAQAKAALAALNEAQRMCIRRYDDLYPYYGAPLVLGAYNSGKCIQTRASRSIMSWLPWLRLRVAAYGPTRLPSKNNYVEWRQLDPGRWVELVEERY